MTPEERTYLHVKGVEMMMNISRLSVPDEMFVLSFSEIQDGGSFGLPCEHVPFI